MGHTEMLLAVAGLDSEKIRERTSRLASGDWSSFAPSEQVAFSFVGKQAREPASIDDADFEQLTAFFGQERALDVVWWSCRCHYMTCVADALQLPLETENVFKDPVTTKESAK